jgi:predicted nucleic acid-binding protein
MSEVCVDASFALKLVLPEPMSTQIRTQWQSWVETGTTIVAPWLWLFECHAVLRRKVWRQEITDGEARDAWRLLRRQAIQPVHPRGIFDRAWVLARELNRSTTYDTVYMAAAELRGCELWTADSRLAHAAGARYPWIRTPDTSA